MHIYCLKFRFLVLVLFSVTSCFICNAQYGPNKVFLKGDSVILTKYAYLSNMASVRNPLPTVTIHSKDGPKITIDKIDHIEGYSSDGKPRYFGVATFGASEIFAERVIQGKRVDVYRNNVITYSGGIGYSSKLLHYSKDGGPVERVNYRNLKRDLKDGQAARKKLRGANAIRLTQLGLYALGTFVLIKTIKDETDKPVGPPGDVSIPSGLFVAGGLLFLPWIINKPKQRQFELACELYE